MNSLAAEGILLLGYDRDNTATVCRSEREYYHSVVTAERILPLSVCLSVGFSRGVTATVCLSERGYCHSKTKKMLRRIFDPRPIAGTKFYIYSYIIFMGSTSTSIYMEIYVYCIHIYEYIEI